MSYTNCLPESNTVTGVVIKVTPERKVKGVSSSVSFLVASWSGGFAAASGGFAAPPACAATVGADPCIASITSSAIQAAGQKKARNHLVSIYNLPNFPTVG